MGESISATWTEVFQSRGMTLHPAPAPPGSKPGTPWHQGLTAFEKHSFIRLLIREEASEATVFVELAAGPPEGQETSLANAACQWLNRATPASWELVSAAMPANLSATLPNAEALYASLDALLAFMARASEVDTAEGWLTFFGSSGDGPTTSATPTPASGARANSPFETIGQRDSPHQDTDASATHAPRLEVVDGGAGPLMLNVHLSNVLGGSESQRLAHALSHYLHARYDVQAHHAADRSSPHTLSLTVEPERYLGSRQELASDLERFCKRLGDYIDAGGDLQDYLGTNDVVLPSPRQDSPSPAPSRSASLPDAAPSYSHYGASEGSGSGVVFDLSSASASTARELVQGDFSDSRLKRDDAQTALVDLVLRHPGYSDRRINQVLTILLSIDYAAAERLAESAPCVIAWGLSRERALSFKDVLHSAGGKALLVEPGTFGES
ncbi:hypothetical protein EA187_05240 [Lujinxingia sediminis]|uniref:Uncharacterized protein n=1 Tax=Lujinxingia sediminis TaxID=2480984 RepID=A0ABY0CYP5_9DELT|nr:hypothetical protein [Lujinxingia sediminis]RVU48834.1 hypothetical protein EA187_05240 [Lujinxingia sediminis]